MRFIITLCILPFYLCAQSPIFHKVKLEEKLAVSDIEQDRFGFLWFTSDLGVSRYNGFEEQRIDNCRDSSKPLCILHHQGRMYVGNKDGLIKVFDEESLKLIDTFKISDNRVCDIDELDDETLLISVHGEGLRVINLNNLVFRSIELPSKFWNVYETLVVSDSLIFFGTDRGLLSYDLYTEKHSLIDGFEDQIITHLTQSSNGIWASTYDTGLIYHNIKTKASSKILFQDQEKIQDLLVVEDNIYVSAADWVKIYNPKSDSWSTIEIEGQTQRKVTKLFVDAENNLWLAENKDNFWKANLFFYQLDLHIKDQVQSICKINNSFLIGTDRSLYRYEMDTKRVQKLIEGNVTSILILRDYIVLGTYTKGVIVIDKDDLSTRLSIDKNNGLGDNSVLCLETVGPASLYVSTLSGVKMITINSDNIFSIKGLPSETSLNYIMDIQIDQDSNVWMSKDRGGILLLNNEKLITFDQLGDKKMGSVNSISISSDNTKWFSSVNFGLLKYEGDSLRVININYKKEDPYTSIISLPNKNLLLIKKSSIDIFNTTKEHMMYFDTEVGVVVDEPFLNNYCRLNDELWFVHHNQLFKFHSPLPDQKIHPTTSIDNIEVNLEDMGKEKHVFYHDQNNFKFNFTGGWLTDPEKLSYSYFLECYDDDWRITKDRNVNYPHLPPGQYVFHVKSAENSIFSDEPITSFKFKIKRAIYKSWWFILILASGVLGFIYYLLKRSQREKELKAELEQKQIEGELLNLKSQLNPHFLFNSFNVLTGFIEESPNRAVSYLDQLSDFYRRILQHGNKKLIHLGEELDLIENYSQLVKGRFPDGFNLDINVPQRNFYIPPLTLQMLLENAIKHNQISSTNPLKIQILQKGERIIIKNNKIEKNFRSNTTGLGLNNISERFRLLKFGDIDIQNGKEKFIVSLPLMKIIQNENL